MWTSHFVVNHWGTLATLFYFLLLLPDSNQSHWVSFSASSFPHKRKYQIWEHMWLRQVNVQQLAKLKKMLIVSQMSQTNKIFRLKCGKATIDSLNIDQPPFKQYEKNSFKNFWALANFPRRSHRKNFNWDC